MCDARNPDAPVTYVFIQGCLERSEQVVSKGTHQYNFGHYVVELSTSVGLRSIYLYPLGEKITRGFSRDIYPCAKQMTQC